MTHAPADPVTALLHRHRDLCERAVDPMEIAALLEAQGVTDRTAARFRHRDVFSLAEELYARVPRVLAAAPGDGAVPVPGPRRARRLRGLVRDLLPGALAAAAVAVAVAAPHAAPPGGTAAVAVATAVAAVAVLAALGAALRRRLPARRHALASLTAATAVVLLVGHTLGGPWLLADVARGLAPPGTEAARAAARDALVLAAAIAPALWSADRFAALARRRLAGSRTLRELAGATRPLLIGAVAGFAAVLAVLLGLAVLLPPLLPGGPAVWPAPTPWQAAAVLAVGLLLHTALLVACGGRRTAAVAVLVAVVGVLLVACSLLAASWLPGLRAAAHPVEGAVAVGGSALPTAAAAGAAWLVLLLVAWRTLTGPWAHHGPPDGPPPEPGPPEAGASGAGCDHAADTRGAVGHAPPAGWRPRPAAADRSACAAAATPAVPPPR
ncbi:hypothetical protein [Streptomyces bohaiensis]|uniref:hypothetical protein n=1 Tax=Streptomyces bohaiensis TaxID=1431344 RepID=UPI0030C6F7A1